MPSRAAVSSEDHGRKSMDSKNIGANSTSLHTKLANFVLDLQTDVRLEDLLDNNENARVGNVETQRHIPPHRKEQHVKHLRHLYEEIKRQQNACTNGHQQANKRQQAEPGFARNKTMKNSEFSILDADCLDETWLLNFAAQLGLDKKMDLPELNSEFMQDFL